MTHFDVLIVNGTVFSGDDSDPVRADVGISGDTVTAIDDLSAATASRTIDADGKWVIPGILDVHTHYDAEVLGNPGLGESTRHGVTTVVMGNCSLSTVHGEPDDIADCFARVEALPWDVVAGAVKEHKVWHDAGSYIDHIDSLPLGANVAAFIGHSDIRTTVMGMDRSTRESATPAEIEQMSTLVADALDEGFVGLSTIRSSFSKLEGTRWPARQLPSTFGTWREFRRLNREVRSRGRVHQSTPNLTRRLEIAKYFAQSIPFRGRPAMRTSLISAADIKADRTVIKAATISARIINRVFGGDFRWQHLPVPFEVYADGVDLVVFEEFGSGTLALDIRDVMERTELLRDESYRRAFRKDIGKRFGQRVWHRDLGDAFIVACPDASVVGRSFADVAAGRGIEPADALLDLAVEHGADLRWRTVIANDRDDELDSIARSDEVQVGFSDSGAHLRNMAFYNFGVRFLERCHERGFMPVHSAVHRLTGELADWYGLDAGHLEVGKRADLAVIDPAGFDGSSAQYAEAELPGTGVSRMVNRNDAAVAATVVGGQIVAEYGALTPVTARAGRFLRARNR